MGKAKAQRDKGTEAQRKSITWQTNEGGLPFLGRAVRSILAQVNH
jgi:hypothetical protein